MQGDDNDDGGGGGAIVMPLVYSILLTTIPIIVCFVS